MLKLLFIISYSSVFGTTAVFGQLANYTWTGAADGTNLDTAGNFTTNGVNPAVTLPSGNDLSGLQESVLWDGRTTTNLNLGKGAIGWPGTGLGSFGVNLVLTANQTNNVQIISPVALSQAINTFCITNNSPNATFILGDNTANQLEIITRPGTTGTVHHFVNNSTNSDVINSSVQWLFGGGVACVLSFGGRGNWIVNHSLRANNFSGPFSVELTGPGSMTWSNGGVFNSALGPITILGGTMILKSAGLAPNFTGSGTVTNNNSITNNGTLQYDAVAQVDIIARDISGTGLLKVSNGTLTLSGANIYSGGTIISGGTLQVGTNGTSGSIGSGNVTNNSSLIFNRSDIAMFGNVISGTGSMVQNGSGTLTITGMNTFTGSTTVSNGTLVVSSVGGDMNVNGGTLVPAALGSIGTLNVAGNMTISSGTALASLNKSLSPSNSFVSVTGNITNFGGTLRLLNFGPNLAVNDKFIIFNKAVGGGVGMTIVSPGFTVTNHLAVDGSVTVTAVASSPAIITPTISGGQLNLSWPASWVGLHLQAQTNSLTVGLSNNWFTVTGTDAGNNYLTILNNSNESVFYRLAP